ncbi:Putative FAD-depending monooxygenase [Kitasatospora sp. MMS16-BH015]|uniref:FAD-dependent monooxygenase n=1 Tax=Kitasatospora sp. MMS16-BH015 TaxID=2018025 RepID=UPI000CA29DE4|nr:FAD-dependent monooxygenase [Kitasatospora sp. MMS16-BH015]AUG78925.1 Putative FAD-depending monooxygenase [Kitasatospora sp. MMS16-BH015]
MPADSSRPGPGRSAVVVGGGIGGLAAAVGLHRTGWRVTVLERAPEPREAGAGISLLTNAQRALDLLGLGDAVRANAAVMAPGGEGLRLASGRRLQPPADPAFLRERGLSLLVLTRPALHGLLRAALPDGALRTGAAVTRVVDQGGSAVAFHRTPEGEQAVSGDLVIAADGAFSAIRSALWPQVPPPVYSGHSVWRGIAEGVDSAAEPGGSTWGRGLEFGRMPLGGDRVYWFAVANTPEGRRFPDEHAEVLRRFGSWHQPVPALIAATPLGGVLRHDVFELAQPLPGYVSGRVAVLGDAAHAMTSDLGQGACQALEDAAVLCAVLAAQDDIPRALADYDEQRRPRSQSIVEASRRMGELKLTERPWQLLRRNARMRRTQPRASQQGLAMVGDWHPPALPEPAAVAAARPGEAR